MLFVLPEISPPPNTSVTRPVVGCFVVLCVVVRVGVTVVCVGALVVDVLDIEDEGVYVPAAVFPPVFFTGDTAFLPLLFIFSIALCAASLLPVLEVFASLVSAFATFLDTAIC